MKKKNALTMLKKLAKEVKKIKKHRHSWNYDFNDCPNCGGCEVRWCKKDECYKNQVKNGNKWEDE